MKICISPEREGLNPFKGGFEEGNRQVPNINSISLILSDVSVKISYSHISSSSSNIFLSLFGDEG